MPDMMYYKASGSTSLVYHTHTHLSAILQPGDTALGYFLTNANFNSDHFASLPADRILDLILVKKTHPNHRKKNRPRNWKLRSIAKEAGEEGETSGARGAIGRMGGRDQRKVEQDYELFLRDLEEDLELRQGINLYKAPEVTMAAADGAAAPSAGAGGRKGGRRRPGQQYTMDMDDMPAEVVPPQAATGIVGVDGDNEEEVEEEPDFPDVKATHSRRPRA
ncbi:hypothetical protein CPB84DRAFT_1844083 [Gymnopilus junonius]|uniref:60S ribosomal export protein NMD3 OB-fold domain-containing protein n=1 Tax=Gymnopilus junonius TaxID=109634 RepID=A0A9P5NSB1_GYMJU|nr:hypothetical protein CPB84DRAFT_1844083 [Gymnopilus junonius]